MELVAYRVQRRVFPPSHPFYCLRCAVDLADKSGWLELPKGDEQRAVPVIRTDSGVVRQVAIGRSREFSVSVEYEIQDEGFGGDETMSLFLATARLGTRWVPSLPAEVGRRVACATCKVRILDAQGMPLGK